MIDSAVYVVGWLGCAAIAVSAAVGVVIVVSYHFNNWRHRNDPAPETTFGGQQDCYCNGCNAARDLVIWDREMRGVA